MDKSTTHEFAVQRKPVARYFYWIQIVMIVVVGVWFCGAGIPLALLYGLTLGLWLPRRQAEALRYWLEGTTLRVDHGVFFLRRKAIPVDRITDVVLAQGPLMKLCGIWEVRIQTAGTGQTTPEACLYGLTEPEAARDRLLMARDEPTPDEY